VGITPIQIGPETEDCCSATSSLRLEFKENGAGAGRKTCQSRSGGRCVQAVKQPDPQLFLQLHDLLGKGRLGHLLVLGRAGEASASATAQK